MRLLSFIIVFSGCSGSILGGPFAGGQGVPEIQKPPHEETPPGGITKAFCDGRARPIPWKGVHRLNRVEYNNTLRDLLGDESRPASAFVPDVFTNSFANIASSLQVSGVLGDQLEAAAWTVAGSAVKPTALGTRPFGCAPLTDACAEVALFDFARRAFRRPLSDEHKAWLRSLMTGAKQAGENTLSALQTAVAGTLLSPFFLYRLELDSPATSGASRPLDEFELATRLSYMLWSSMPDDELLSLAEQGLLRGQILTQVDRMRRHAKSEAFIEQFVGNWLELYSIEAWEPLPTKFPNIDLPLKRAMKQEIEMVFKSTFDEGLDLRDLFRTDFTFLTPRLAAHYGIPSAPGSDALTRSTAIPEERRSLLGKAGLLMISATQGEAPVVRRGQFILDKLLGEHLEFPNLPKDVKDKFDEERKAGALTERQLLAKHAESAVCYACHSRLDPLGFGLSGFDAVGRYIPSMTGAPVDDSGEMADGTPFRGSVQLSAILRNDPRFLNHFSKMLLTYGLGKVLEGDERCIAVDLTDAMATTTHRFDALLSSLVQHPAFTHRTGATQ